MAQKMNTEVKIVKAYLAFTEENNREPRNKQEFFNQSGYTTETFEEGFDSFTALREYIWNTLYDETLERLTGEEVFQEYPVREKLLAFYFTWFEVLKDYQPFARLSVQRMARYGYVVDYFTAFRPQFNHFVGQLLEQGQETGEVAERPFGDKVVKDGLWKQLQWINSFWANDKSEDNAQTDAAVEKSVNLAMDLLGNTPVDSALDLGKFIFDTRIKR